MFIIGRWKIEDEKIISALLSNTTVNSAADEIGCNPSVIYARRKDATFLRKLQQAQDDALSGTVRYLQSSMATAAETLVDISLNGSEQNRLTASRTILEQAARLTETVDVVERLHKIEAIMGGDIEG